jgi:hypothetical protein
MKHQANQKLTKNHRFLFAKVAQCLFLKQKHYCLYTTNLAHGYVKQHKTLNHEKIASAFTEHLSIRFGHPQ